jgi:hypothetical protein
LSAPVDGQAVRGAIRLEGSAVAPKFSHYQVELGIGTSPQTFIVIQGAITQTMRRSLLGTLDTRQLENGPYTLRLVVFDQLGGFTDDRALILVDNPPDSIAARTPVTTPPFTPTPPLTATLTLTTPATPAGTPPAPTPALLLDSAARVFTAPVSIPPQPLPTTP